MPWTSRHWRWSSSRVFNSKTWTVANNSSYSKCSPTWSALVSTAIGHWKWRSLRRGRRLQRAARTSKSCWCNRTIWSVALRMRWGHAHSSRCMGSLRSSWKSCNRATLHAETSLPKTQAHQLLKQKACEPPPKRTCSAGSAQPTTQQTAPRITQMEQDNDLIQAISSQINTSTASTSSPTCSHPWKRTRQSTSSRRFFKARQPIRWSRLKRTGNRTDKVRFTCQISWYWIRQK